jgi:hypothetical protein
MTHSALVQLGLKWLRHRCTIAFAEFACGGSWEIPDVIGWRGGNSTLIECKTSRADFKADFKKPHRKGREYWPGMGRRRYYLCPSRLIQLDELPERWGLLWTGGKIIHVMKEPKGFDEIDERAEQAFLVSMLRRAQVRLGTTQLSEWLHVSNMYDQPEAK